MTGFKSIFANKTLKFHKLKIWNSEETVDSELLSKDHYVWLISAKIKKRIELLHYALSVIRRSMENL